VGGCSSFANKGFWGGLVRVCKSSAMCGGVAFLILNAPAGRKAGGKKLKPRASGVIIFFFSFFELLSGIILSQPS